MIHFILAILANNQLVWFEFEFEVISLVGAGQGMFSQSWKLILPFKC